MCMVSMIYDQAKQTWPQVDRWPIQPQIDYWRQWQELVEKAKKYDELTKQPDCEDPSKAVMWEKVMVRLDELEKKIDAK